MIQDTLLDETESLFFAIKNESVMGIREAFRLIFGDGMVDKTEFKMAIHHVKRGNKDKWESELAYKTAVLYRDFIYIMRYIRSTESVEKEQDMRLRSAINLFILRHKYRKIDEDDDAA